MAVGRGEQLVRVAQAINKAGVSLDWGLHVAFEIEEDAVREGQTLSVRKLAKAIEEEFQKRGSKVAGAAASGAASSGMGDKTFKGGCYFCSGDHRSDSCSMNTNGWRWKRVQFWYNKGLTGQALVDKLKYEDSVQKQQGYQGYARQAYGAPQQQVMAPYPHWAHSQPYQSLPPQPAPPQGLQQWSHK